MKAKLLMHNQLGAATLLTALVLLVGITLITLLTSKTVLVETQITADNYRTGQATAAANAAMEQAVAYFNAGGLDQHNNATPATLTADGLVDYTGPSAEPTATSCAMPVSTTFPLILTSSPQTTYAQFYFNNLSGNACDCLAGNCMTSTDMTRALVTAKGWSDDCSAARTITQCVATFNVFDGGQGPQQPFVSKAGVGVFGNAKIINRYTNVSIWSGGVDTVHGASYGTYLRLSGTEIADYTTAQLDDSNEANNAQLVSNRNAGNGVDVVTEDPTLGSKTTSRSNLTDPVQNQFFDLFFAHTKSDLKNAANTQGQMLAAGANPSGLNGLIWIDGNTDLHNGDIVGTPTNPAILIVNGDFTLTGGPIYGVIYVIGELKIAGNPVVTGSVISENGPNSGAGTLTLVYKPLGGTSTGLSPPFIAGTGAIIAGSWKDW